ncbi:hypothetical protein [Prosthecochloris sp.]|uniref:hypothetical protein n=1 Tax=Prosthecochloris sp. TaxID=290513 RepID=UPI0025DD0EB8|nr:hypothetical protein [Prosthecochloris sp.]
MQISVRSNIKEVTRNLSKMEKKFVPNATRNAINDTLFGLRTEFSKEIKSVFDMPVSFTTSTKAWYIEKAQKSKLQGILHLKRAQEKYLQYQIYGGREKPEGGKRKAIPVPQANYRAKHGGLKRNWKAILDRPQYFSGTVKKLGGKGESRPGIYLRIGKRKWSKSEKRMVGQKFRLEVGWEEMADYKKPKLNLEKIKDRYVKKHFSRIFREKLNWYMRNRM